MAGDTSSNKQRAHELIERLDTSQVSAVVPLLEFMLLDPASRALAAAELEDKPVPHGEAGALDQAHAALARGEAVSHDDILREFGLTPR